jgi:hypothetical protein
MIFIKSKKYLLSNCWAFAAATSVEAALFNKTKQHIILSVQQLTDCSSDTNYSCKISI